MKKKWTLVFTCESFCTQARLKNAMTLEEARDTAKTDVLCGEFSKNGHEFRGVLGVDITRKDLKKMGYQL